MKERIKLFSAVRFRDYEREKYDALSKEIMGMSDDYVFNLKNSVEAMTKAIANKHQIGSIEVGFNEKKAKIVNVPGTSTQEKRIIEYTIPIKGNSALLSVWPYQDNGYSPENVMGEINNSVLVITIDTNYYADPVPDRILMQIQETLKKIEEYVNQTCISLNAQVNAFNTRIETEIKQSLEAKIIKGEVRNRANNFLNK